MKKSKPPSLQRRLRPQIKTIMTKLTKPNLRSHNNYISLYNDFLILSVVAQNIPDYATQRLSDQLSIFHQSLIKHLDQQQSFDNCESNLNLRPIMQILSEVPTNDALLKDFLTCSGYKREKAIEIN